VQEVRRQVVVAALDRQEVVEAERHLCDGWLTVLVVLVVLVVVLHTDGPRGPAWSPCADALLASTSKGSGRATALLTRGDGSRVAMAVFDVAPPASWTIHSRDRGSYKY
jgi:hypothetical protein